MGQNVSNVETEEIQTIEYQIFDKSFTMIEKYMKGETKGLRDAFNREYEWVLINEGDGDLNWHKIMPKQMKGAIGSYYIHAIQTIGQLVKEAEQVSNSSEYRFQDKSKFREIYRLVDSLIDLREKEQASQNCCCFWTINDQADIENQMFKEKAWDEFRSGHD